VDHYEANGWLVGGKSPMRDWKAAVRTWEHNEPRFSRNGRPGGMTPAQQTLFNLQSREDNAE
jgi:hypothetical protein